MIRKYSIQQTFIETDDNGLFQKISTHPPWTTLEILQEMLSEHDWKS